MWVYCRVTLWKSKTERGKWQELHMLTVIMWHSLTWIWHVTMGTRCSLQTLQIVPITWGLPDDGICSFASLPGARVPGYGLVSCPDPFRKKGSGHETSYGYVVQWLFWLTRQEGISWRHFSWNISWIFKCMLTGCNYATFLGFQCDVQCSRSFRQGFSPSLPNQKSLDYALPVR